jgi:DNA-binding NtrC family response regulator
MADVVIFNSSDELLDALSRVLEDEGLSVATAHVAHFRENLDELGPFLERHRPRAIIYDVAPMYDESWAWFRTVFCAHPAVAGMPIVVTTTNLRALQSFGIEAHAFELVGKPYDLNRILEAIENALGHHPAPSSPSSSPAGSPA